VLARMAVPVVRADADNREPRPHRGDKLLGIEPRAMYPSITTFPLREWVAARHRTDQVTAFGGYGEFTPLLFDTASPQHLPVRARRSVVRRRTLRQGQRPVAQRDSNSRCRLERAAQSTSPLALAPGQTAPLAGVSAAFGRTFGTAALDEYQQSRTVLVTPIRRLGALAVQPDQKVLFGQLRGRQSDQQLSPGPSPLIRDPASAAEEGSTV
jgi:hypothetical protein